MQCGVAVVGASWRRLLARSFQDSLSAQRDQRGWLFGRQSRRHARHRASCRGRHMQMNDGARASTRRAPSTAVGRRLTLKQVRAGDRRRLPAAADGDGNIQLLRGASKQLGRGLPHGSATCGPVPPKLSATNARVPTAIRRSVKCLMLRDFSWPFRFLYYTLGPICARLVAQVATGRAPSILQVGRQGAFGRDRSSAAPALTPTRSSGGSGSIWTETASIEGFIRDHHGVQRSRGTKAVLVPRSTGRLPTA